MKWNELHTHEWTNLHALVLDLVGECSYKLGTKSGVLKGLFSRHQFQASPTNFLERSDINLDNVDVCVRTAARLQSLNSDQTPTKCACKGKCSDRRCTCKKSNFKCNSKCACNSGKICKNRDT